MAFLAITPNDSAPLPNPVLRIFVGESGDIAILGYHDVEPVVLKAVPAGWMTMPLPIVTVMATGTTATNLVSASY